MNNNRTDEAALLAGTRGVFSKSSYITIGTEGKPVEYGLKPPPREALKGKQFITNPSKKGDTNDVYFEKKHNWISDGDHYVDKLRYMDMQKDKKKGFLTSDFSKRDEFSNTIRTEQWREQLKQENVLTKKDMALMEAATQELEQSLTTSQRYGAEDELTLYDRIHEKTDPNANGASRTHRDTKNRTMMTTERYLGSLATTTGNTYKPPEDFSKPAFARKPLIRDTFYRKTNVFFPANCCATPEDE